MSPKSTIIDWGVGNLGSLRRWLESLGHQVTQVALGSGPPDFVPNLVVLPGAGNALHVLSEIRLSGWHHILRALSRSGSKTLGICLGGQILFDWHEEAGTDGLGALPGVVKRIDSSQKVAEWCHLRFDDPGTEWLLNEKYFFNHSFGVPASSTSFDNSLTWARKEHSDTLGLAISDSFAAVQFHPEKSGGGAQEFGALLNDWVSS